MRKFSEIIGQKAIIEHLYNALRTGSVSHAYIISGDAGSGRKTIASIFAAALQCEDLEIEEVEPADPPAAARKPGRAVASPAGESSAASQAGESAAAQPKGKYLPGQPAMRPRTRLLEPCGKCLSCIQVQSGNQPDIITITHEKPNSISVKEIRDMRADLSIKPYANARKIYIIPDAEKLTIQAQNALLKTLEEPPEYAVPVRRSADAGRGGSADCGFPTAREEPAPGPGTDPGALRGRLPRAGTAAHGRSGISGAAGSDRKLPDASASGRRRGGERVFVGHRARTAGRGHELRYDVVQGRFAVFQHAK